MSGLDYERAVLAAGPLGMSAVDDMGGRGTAGAVPSLLPSSP